MNHGKSACPARFMMALGVLVSMIVGCVSNNTRLVSRTESLPRPDHILVHDFAVSPNEVSPGNTLIYKLHHNELRGPSQTSEQVQIGRAVASVLSEKLVNEIRSLGLPAERAWGVQPLAKGSFSLEGQFMTIDEGNRTQGITIGFGVGNAKVRTLVQGYLGTADGQHLVEEFETNTERSRNLGVGVMVTDVAVRSSELERTAEINARRTTVALAKQLVEFFAAQGWIAQDVAE